MSAPSFTFTLTPDAATPIATKASPQAPAAVTPRPTVKRALKRPFRQDGKGGFARISGDTLLEEKLGTLLGMNGLPWDPARTANLDSLRHMADTSAFRPFARAYVSDAVRRYLPALTLLDVRVEGAREKKAIVAIAVKAAQPDALVRADLPLVR